MIDDPDYSCSECDYSYLDADKKQKCKIIDKIGKCISHYSDFTQEEFNLIYGNDGNGSV